MTRIWVDEHGVTRHVNPIKDSRAATNFVLVDSGPFTS
jgi:hypothetical protein